MFILPLVAYWILVIVVLFLWQDSMFKTRKGRSDEKSVFSGNSGKSKGIFDDAGEHDYAGSSKHHENNVVASRDQYDVDEQGNLKGPSKKHKNFDSGNEGYIELK